MPVTVTMFMQFMSQYLITVAHCFRASVTKYGWFGIFHIRDLEVTYHSLGGITFFYLSLLVNAQSRPPLYQRHRY